MVRLFASVIVLLAFAVAASAAPLCLAGSVADYVALGSGGCSVGDKWFKNFQFSSEGTSAPNSGQVAVSVLGALPFGLTFAAKQQPQGWSIAGRNKSQTTRITYEVAIEAPSLNRLFGVHFRATNIAVEFAEPSDTNTFVQLTKTICLGGPVAGCPSANLITITATFFGNQVVYNASRSWFDTAGYTLIGVQDIVHLQTADLGGFRKAGIDGFIANRFSQVPEPAGYVLLGSGLMALGYLRRRLGRR